MSEKDKWMMQRKTKKTMKRKKTKRPRIGDELREHADQWFSAHVLTHPHPPFPARLLNDSPTSDN
jgi:hypothetical protein